MTGLIGMALVGAFFGLCALACWCLGDIDLGPDPVERRIGRW